MPYGQTLGGIIVSDVFKSVRFTGKLTQMRPIGTEVLTQHKAILCIKANAVISERMAHPSG